MSSQSMQNQWHKAQHLHSPIKSTHLQKLSCRTPIPIFKNMVRQCSQFFEKQAINFLNVGNLFASSVCLRFRVHASIVHM
jgi:hypothetical protein